jgi:general secretion pathway protein E
LTSEEIAYLQLDRAEVRVWEGAGCGECRGTGYRGRTGIFEILDFSDNVKAVITEKMDLAALYAAARNDGMANLRQVAIRKMLEGLTTYEEVLAITG